jgi:hypothetical protein
MLRKSHGVPAIYPAISAHGFGMLLCDGLRAAGFGERRPKMSHVTYRIVEHDGGWAYKVGDVFSESFATKELARAAAKRAAREQATPGETAAIEFEDSSGHWHDESAKGSDRPDTEVKG